CTRYRWGLFDYW
nr:immunoglobulin heavy chain junction region [Mus musculus]